MAKEQKDIFSWACETAVCGQFSQLCSSPKIDIHPLNEPKTSFNSTAHASLEVIESAPQSLPITN